MAYPSLLIRIAASIVVIVAGATLVYFLAQSARPSSSAAVTVAATIFPLADILEQVGGEHVNVILLLPPGTTEHSSTLRPDVVREISQAQALFYVGHNLDDRLVANVRKITPTLEAMRVDHDINLRPFSTQISNHDHEEAEEHEEHVGDIDPHYWLTVPNAKIIAETVATTLQDIDPAHHADYQRQLEHYQAELDVLEADLQTTASRASQRHFIAMHNAWGYLADHYGFELVGTYEPTEGQQPSLTDLQHLQALVARHALTTFFAEPQKASSGAIRFMEQELGLTTRLLDPIGGLPPRESYSDLMRENVRTLAEPANLTVN